MMKDATRPPTEALLPNPEFPPFFSDLKRVPSLDAPNLGQPDLASFTKNILRDLIMTNQRVLVLIDGPPFAGKSYIARNLSSLLDSQNHPSQRLSYSYISARLREEQIIPSKTFGDREDHRTVGMTGG